MIFKYKAYTLKNYKEIPRIRNLSEEDRFAIDVVGTVFPFKTNNYVINELIDWRNFKTDPMFILHFPQKGMMEEEHFEEISSLIKRGVPKAKIKDAANRIRGRLNPHPAGQMEDNSPFIDGKRHSGMQHKYRETVLFFPSQGQTCHAYCTFCFRWPQFVGIDELRFASKDIETLVSYLGKHREITDVLLTGGDPLSMKTKFLEFYINKILDSDLPHIRSIRIGTKALGHWPQRFFSDDDSEELLGLFRKITGSGRHLAIMAHFNHQRELSTDSVVRAIGLLRETGAEVRTQSPLLRHINDNPETWKEMWNRQVQLGCVPYYMFIARDTGAHQYFGVPIVAGAEIFRDAYRKVSGLARTVRGPSMSASPGKIQVLGAVTINGKRAIALRMLQGRDPKWVLKPFFADYNDEALWLDELKPAFGGENFFFDQK